VPKILVLLEEGLDGSSNLILNIPDDFDTKKEHDAWYELKYQTKNPDFNPDLPEFGDYIKEKYGLTENKDVEVF